MTDKGQIMLRKLLKHIIFLVNIGFVLCLFLSGAAFHISPENTLAALTALSFNFFAIINLCFVAWWIILRKWHFLLSATALLIFVPRYSDFFYSTHTEKNGTLIKVMSYNVRTLGVYEGKPHTSEFLKLLETEKPDILCLTETYNGNNYGNIPAQLKKQFKHVKLHTQSNKMGRAIYSKFPIVNANDNFDFPGTSNGFFYTDIKVKSDTIRVFCCHLQSMMLTQKNIGTVNAPTNTTKNEIKSLTTRLRRGYNKKGHQIDRLRHEVEQSPYPTLICGDMNDTPSSFLYHSLHDVAHDSHRVAGKGWGSTFTSFIFGLRIDYIFFSNQLQCKEFRTLRSDISDHRPVVGDYLIID